MRLLGNASADQAGRGFRARTNALMNFPSAAATSILAPSWEETRASSKHLPVALLVPSALLDPGTAVRLP